MQKHRRMTKSSDFDFVRKLGKSWSDTNMVLVAYRRIGGCAPSRFGFVASKGIGKAVVRNLLKRRMREIVRYLDVESGWDLVFIVRNAGTKAGFGELKGSMKLLLEKARVL